MVLTEKTPGPFIPPHHGPGGEAAVQDRDLLYRTLTSQGCQGPGSGLKGMVGLWWMTNTAMENHRKMMGK